MRQETVDDVRRAVASAVNKPLLNYFNARLDELKTELMNASENSFREIRGRALEVDKFIKILESVKE